MPFLFIRTSNSEFDAIDDGGEYETNEEALAQGVQSAVRIVTDEIHRGEPTAAVDVCIETHRGNTVLRSVVALSVSPLLADSDPFP